MANAETKKRNGKMQRLSNAQSMELALFYAKEENRSKIENGTVADAMVIAESGLGKNFPISRNAVIQALKQVGIKTITAEHGNKGKNTQKLARIINGLFEEIETRFELEKGSVGKESGLRQELTDLHTPFNRKNQVSEPAEK